jgi:Sec-independent protein translocase protein TatA
VEVATDIYRDLILTGVLVTLVVGTWRLSGMHFKAVHAIELVRAELERLKVSIENGFKQNEKEHEKLSEITNSCDRQLADTATKHAERIARIENEIR